MNTMQWQTSGFSFEIDQDDFEHRHTPETKSTTSTEREESQAIQKRKYEDQSTNENRKAHIALIEKFGTLLVENKLEEIARDLLADDVQVFIFGSTAANSVQYANRADEFVNLYKDVHIQERIARETDYDEEKETAGQVCNYKTVFKGESSVIDEVSCELFTIKDGRITRYRVSFGRPRFSVCQFKDPLEHTAKEKMLAKVKEINYALARQPPDFEKVASLLDENVEYKLCGWDAFKSGVLFKKNLAGSFQNLGENTTLLSVVPYELYTNEHGNFVTGTYVYNLQKKVSGKKLVWLSTCVYGFNQNLNITKVIHQGEMYDEDDVEIPFEVFTRSKIQEILNEYYNAESNMDIFYSDKILYDCTLWSLCNEVPDMGYFQGVKDIEELIKTMAFCEELNPSFLKIIDVYVDYHNESHDVAYALLCIEGPSVIDGKPNPEIVTNCIGFMRIAYENGKIAKIFEIVSEIKEPVPTPFDDKAFNFICRK